MQRGRGVEMLFVCVSHLCSLTRSVSQKNLSMKCTKCAVSATLEPPVNWRALLTDSLNTYNYDNIRKSMTIHILLKFVQYTCTLIEASYFVPVRQGLPASLRKTLGRRVHTSALAPSEFLLLLEHVAHRVTCP